MSSAPVAVVGMSGGVDSSVTAALAREAGFQVIGVMLQMKAPGESRDADEKAFLSVAESLGIEAHILPCPEFESEVICRCANIYASGRTPNPCCECNVKVKFKKLFDFASSFPGATVWTGHYAKIENGVLMRGSDRNKDQSYFLYRLPEKWLHSIKFPLGAMSKPEVRRFAENLALPVASRPDSQDICFEVPGESCGETLRRRAGLPEKIGYFLYNGKIVGSHRGVGNFTIGQRSKLGVALGVPAYISKIDASSGNIFLETDRSRLETKEFFLTDTVFRGNSIPEEGEIQIRYRSCPVKATFSAVEKNKVLVTPDQMLTAVTPGQAGVVYSGDTLLGGGVIELPGESVV